MQLITLYSRRSARLAGNVTTYRRLQIVGYETVSDLVASQMVKAVVKQVVDVIRQDMPNVTFIDGIVAIRKPQAALDAAAAAA